MNSLYKSGVFSITAQLYIKTILSKGIGYQAEEAELVDKALDIVC